MTLLVDQRPTQTVSYNPNARPTLMGSRLEARAKVELLVSVSDLVKASDEIAWLYPGVPLSEVLRNWACLGPAVVVATRGGEGAVSHSSADRSTRSPAPATVVDTVGAGDSFMSGLISGLLDARLLGGADARVRLQAAPWEDIEEPAIERARRAAAITVSRQGSNPPTRQDLGSASAPPGSTPLLSGSTEVAGRPTCSRSASPITRRSVAGSATPDGVRVA